MHCLFLSCQIIEISEKIMKKQLITLALIAALTSSFSVNAKMATTSKTSYPTTNSYMTKYYNHKLMADYNKSKSKTTLVSYFSDNKKFFTEDVKTKAIV